MGFRIGILGLANSGKSMSRRTIVDGENCFLIAPSQKANHLFDSNHQPVKQLSVTGKSTDPLKQTSMGDMMAKLGVTTIPNYIKKLQPQPTGTFKGYISGNAVTVKNLDDIITYLDFVNKHMPWIHTVFLADFTHFISEVISKQEFIERHHGNQAYQRFWELSGKALQSFILKSDSLRNDLIVVTEYHGEEKENGNIELFVPAGEMLKKKFMPESYYDVLLVTKVIPDDNGDVDENSYKFVTRRTANIPLARSMNIFKDLLIPNDMQLVLTEVRKYLGFPTTQVTSTNTPIVAAPSITAQSIPPTQTQAPIITTKPEQEFY